VKNVLLKIIQTIFTIYFVIAVFIFIPINNFNFAKENGFVKWIVLGEIVPTLQSSIWPYYVYNSYFSKSISGNDKKYFLETIGALQAINAEFSKQSPSVNDITNYLDAAIQESSKLNMNKIEKNIPGFTESFNSLKECLPELQKAILDKNNDLLNELYPKLTDWDKFTQNNKDKLNELFF